MEIPEVYNEEDKDLWDKAFLLAAPFFVQSWPQEWSSKELQELLLITEGEDDFEKQSQIKIWDIFIGDGINEFEAVYNLICVMSNTLINFRKADYGY